MQKRMKRRSGHTLSELCFPETDSLGGWAGGGEWARTDREATANAQATGHVCWLSELSEGL